jgi:hypothetical protein
MKNLLGIMIIIGAVGCQMVESPSRTEDTVESATVQDATVLNICSGEARNCGATLPQAQWWNGTMPFTTSNTVVLIDTKLSPGYLWLYGADAVKGVMWIRLATAQQAGDVLTKAAVLPAGYMDYTRPPMCGSPNCPPGDGWLAVHMANTAAGKLDALPLVKTTTAACWP